MEHISGPLDRFMEAMGQGCYGRSRKECWSKGICIDCGQPAMPKCHSDAGRTEYHISCLCEECFDRTVGGGE